MHGAAAALQLGEDGTVRLEARGTSWRRLASLLLSATFEAQLADTRRRRKICRDPLCCGVAFYDRSRNNNGVWHDLKTCGNAANLRSCRARQRAQFPDPNHPGRIVARGNKEGNARSGSRSSLPSSAYRIPTVSRSQMALLINGAMVTGLLAVPADLADELVDAAMKLLA